MLIKISSFIFVAVFIIYISSAQGN